MWLYPPYNNASCVTSKRGKAIFESGLVFVVVGESVDGLLAFVAFCEAYKASLVQATAEQLAALASR